MSLEQVWSLQETENLQNSVRFREAAPRQMWERRHGGNRVTVNHD